MSLCGAVCGGGFREGTVPLAWLLADFQSLPPPLTRELYPSGVNSLGRWPCVLSRMLWVYPMNSPKRVLPPLQPPQAVKAGGFEA